MAASRKYGSHKRKNEIAYNLVADVAHGGGTGFQPGSTFKTFTLITALEEGMKINDGFTAGGGYRAPGYSSFKNCKGENIGDPTHTVTNDEGGAGFKTLQTGTWGSVNTFFMTLEQQVGLCDAIKTAKSLGIKRADGGTLQEFETFTLGINEMDPVTVANAYAAIAARGKYCAPMADHPDHRPRRQDHHATSPSAARRIDDEVADAAADILSRGLHQGHDARRRRHRPRPPRARPAPPTPTPPPGSPGSPPTWPARSASATRAAPSKHKLNGVTIGGQYYGEVFGASVPGPIWKDTMLAALKDVDPHAVHADQLGALRRLRPGLRSRTARRRDDPTTPTPTRTLKTPSSTTRSPTSRSERSEARAHAVLAGLVLTTLSNRPVNSGETLVTWERSQDLFREVHPCLSSPHWHR